MLVCTVQVDIWENGKKEWRRGRKKVNERCSQPGFSNTRNRVPFCERKKKTIPIKN